MFVYCLVAILSACIPTLYCFKLPIHVSPATEKCSKSTFKQVIECGDHIGSSVYASLAFGSIHNPNIQYHINLVLDSGSSVTWLATKSTKFFDLKGQSKGWKDIFDSSVKQLDYTPDKKDQAGQAITKTYADKRMLTLVSYKNHQLKFTSLVGGDFIVPMDIYFAEEYHVNHSGALFIGILGLKFLKEPKDVDNLFLYRFLKDRKNAKPMMSIDFNFYNGKQGDSSLGLGEPLSMKKKLVGPTVPLDSHSDYWKINIDYVTLEFPGGRRPQIEFKSTTGLLDTGATHFGIVKLRVLQMTLDQQKIFKTPYSLSCDQYEKLLPKIVLGFRHGGRLTNITIPASKLYIQYQNEPTKCHGLLTQFEEQRVSRFDFWLGLPFFSATYVEQSFYDTRNLKSWSDMNFKGKVAITAKY